MSNEVKLEFSGDAGDLVKESKKASDAVDAVGKSTNETASDMEGAKKSTESFGDRIGKLGAGVSGLTDGVDAASASVQALADIQSASKNKAAAMARAQADVEQATIDAKQASVDLTQATLDLSQAQTDGAQAGLDFEQAEIDQHQATLDAATAQKEYNAAVKEHGKNSDEAKQASIDLEQAQADLKQSNIDMDQAVNDTAQAENDATQAKVDSTQATRDGKDAQLDLNDAMSEANPTGLQTWANNINMVAPLLSGLVGIVGLVTAAQWAWNAAQAASPTTWIILAIVALIAVIVLIATKTTWFQDIWKATWGGIKSAASAVGSWFRDTLWRKWILGALNGIQAAGEKAWNWFKDLPRKFRSTFASIGGFISAPFRAAFNLISTAWNNTIGRLSWTVPGWIPGIGGNSFSAPRLPHFHSGVGAVPGTPGSEVLAVLQAGERVSSASSNQSSAEPILLGSDGSRLGDLLIEVIQMAMQQRRSGDPRALGLRV